MGRYFFLSLIALLFVVIFVACAASVDSSQPVRTPEGNYPIDPQFSELYAMLGGKDVLGPAISPSFSDKNRKFQYVQAGSLEYNGELPSSQAYRLSPLGVELGIHEPGVPQPDDPDSLYVNGHVISGSFKKLYERMKGARFVGKPLSEVHYNESKRRHEQYFENAAFYELESEPGMVRLLALGSWKCGTHCRTSPPAHAVVELPAAGVTIADEYFAEAVSRLGPIFTGFALTNVYLTPDGYKVQIFENLVLAARFDSPAHVFTLPLTENLGILPDPLVREKVSDETIFFVVDGDLGYNVLRVFIDFIAMHGGMEISGPPVGEATLVSDGVYRQCFRNLCLMYYENMSGPVERKVRPKSLGYHFRDQNYQPSAVGYVEAQPQRMFNVHVSELHQWISPVEEQEIFVYVFEGITPLTNIEPLLQITLPDGSNQSFYFPPTDVDGQTTLSLPPVGGQNGTLVPYQVCISSIIEETFCVKESFLVVANP
jgi:hypothetical protein